MRGPASLSGSFCSDPPPSSHPTWAWPCWDEHAETLLGGSTHVYDDAHGLVIGEENAHSAAVLHDFVVMEGQFVHRVVGWPVGGLGALVFSNFSGSQHSKANFSSSSYGQQKHRGAPQCRFHSCRKPTGRPENKGGRESVKQRGQQHTTGLAGTGKRNEQVKLRWLYLVQTHSVNCLSRTLHS